jgi:hypothetical protein
VKERTYTEANFNAIVNEHINHPIFTNILKNVAQMFGQSAFGQYDFIWGIVVDPPLFI